jgi:hypothetical protein
LASDGFPRRLGAAERSERRAERSKRAGIAVKTCTKTLTGALSSERAHSCERRIARQFAWAPERTKWSPERRSKRRAHTSSRRASNSWSVGACGSGLATGSRGIRASAAARACAVWRTRRISAATSCTARAAFACAALACAGFTCARFTGARFTCTGSTAFTRSTDGSRCSWFAGNSAHTRCTTFTCGADGTRHSRLASDAGSARGTAHTRSTSNTGNATRTCRARYTSRAAHPCSSDCTGRSTDTSHAAPARDTHGAGGSSSTRDAHHPRRAATRETGSTSHASATCTAASRSAATGHAAPTTAAEEHATPGTSGYAAHRTTATATAEEHPSARAGDATATATPAKKSGSGSSEPTAEQAGSSAAAEHATAETRDSAGLPGSAATSARATDLDSRAAAARLGRDRSVARLCGITRPELSVRFRSMLTTTRHNRTNNDDPRPLRSHDFPPQRHARRREHGHPVLVPAPA